MFIVLCSFSLSIGTSGDLTPPFYPDSNGKIGPWKVGGAAQIDEFSIQLVQPIQFRRGCIWTNLEIPRYKIWDISFKVRISETNGGGFAFWFIDKYAESGQLFGGPNTFKGVSFMFQVLSDRIGLNLGVNMVTNDGTNKILLKDIEKPDGAFRFKLGEQITIKFEFNDNKVGIFSRTEDLPEPKLLFTKQIAIDISENYMGITAQSDRNTLLCELNSVEFSVNENEEMVVKKKKIHHHSVEKSTEKYKPEEFYRLRNPAFVQTIVEMMKLDNSAGMMTSESSISDIFNVIEETNKATFDVATYSDLNKFITTRITNYSERWQRRTLRMVERAAETRNVTGSALKYAEELMKAFGNALQENSNKTRRKVNAIGEILAEASDEAIAEIDFVGTSKVAQFLSYFGLAELVLLWVYLCYSVWGKDYQL